MFCHTGTAYPKIGRTIVTNTLARETGEAPTLLENCERVKPLVFVFLILLSTYRLYRGSTVVDHAISTVISWLSLTCCIGKLAKGWEFTMPLALSPLTWSSKTQWKMQKTSPYEQKNYWVSKGGKETFVFKFSTKILSLYSFWERSFLHNFITWALVWVLSVSRSHDISISLEKGLQVNEQLNVVYSRLSVSGS